MYEPEDNPTPESESPISMLDAAAISTHELFRSYVSAGFTEQQALQLIVGMLTASQNFLPPQPPSDGQFPH